MSRAALELAARAACAAELELRGMHQVAPGVFERELAPGIVGRVRLGLDQISDNPGEEVIWVTPHVSVWHEETSHLVSMFLRIAPGDPARRSRGVVHQHLLNLIPDSPVPRPEWVLADEADAADVARRVADDVTYYGFRYLEGLRSAEAIIREMELPLHRGLRRMDLAVLYMLTGRPADAQRLLMEVRPSAQNPTVWENEQYGAFIDAFSAYFRVDLGIESWPVRGQKAANSELTFNIREPGVVRNALLSVGRGDLAGQAAGLTADQVKQIGVRSAEIFSSMRHADLGRAIGLAAAELMGSRH